MFCVSFFFGEFLGLIADEWFFLLLFLFDLSEIFFLFSFLFVFVFLAVLSFYLFLFEGGDVRENSSSSPSDTVICYNR